MRFKDKVVIVTGAARGQGRSHAVAFAREGAKVAVNDIGRDLKDVPYSLSGKSEVDQVVEEIRKSGGTAVAALADVSDATQVREMVDRVVQEYGRLDIMVNNAGIASINNVVDMEESEWDRIIAVDLKGVFLCCKYAARQMIKQKSGRIINTSSIFGWVGSPGYAHYVSAKHGVLGLTRSLAIELAPYNITVNAVCPTGVEHTGIINKLWADRPDMLEACLKIQGVWSLFPDRPNLQPEEVTNAVLWLASDESKSITGIGLPVDAGFLAK